MLIKAASSDVAFFIPLPVIPAEMVLNHTAEKCGEKGKRKQL
jgi:hypothetical protein